MLGRIAKLYYEYDLTHQQIADLLGWSRVKVTRALSEARQQGIVEITVHSDEPLYLEEEQALRERFRLVEAWVGPPVSDPATGALATIGAECITNVVRNGMQVAVGLSTTLAAIASAISPISQPDTTFVPLQGTNPGLVTPPTPSNTAQAFASAFGGHAHALAAPVFASSPEMHAMLAGDVHVREAFDTARRSNLALVGIGGVVANSSIVLSGRLTAGEARELTDAGAVGDINARFYDAAGKAVLTPATSLILGLTLEEFVEIPVRLAAAAGPLKTQAIVAALRGGLVNGLITDQPTARTLLLA